MEDTRGTGEANAGGGEPDDVRELRTTADTVREALIDATLMAHGDELQRIVGIAQIGSHLARLEPSARHTVWNMQPDLFYDPHDPSPELNEASRSRGVETLSTRPGCSSRGWTPPTASRPPG